MPWFESLSDFVTALSPRRQPQDKRSAAQRGPTTPPSRSRRSLPSRNIFSVGFDDDKPLSEVTAGGNVDLSTHPEALHSYVDTISSQPGSPREHTREQLSQPFLELGTWPGHSPQMVNKDQRADSQDRKDEVRLFGGKHTSDAQNGVKITPGQISSRHKKPGAGFGPSPVDHIWRSRNARMSGPVRAQGKSNKPTSILKQSSHLDDAFEESNRPSKRRRQSDPIDLVNDDRSATDSTRNRSPRTSPLAPSKSKGKRLAREIDEFRDTEKMLACSPRRARDTRGSSRTSNIERFTEVATQQRRERFDARNSSSKPNGHPERASRSLLLDGNEGSTKYTGDQSTVSSDTARRSDRESPDELQGDVTTDRIPISWAEKTHTTNPRNAKSLVEKLIRKRSPTDIQTTDFAGSPQQGPKRTKRSHKKASFSIPLKSTFFRIGHFTQSFKKEEPAILQLREDGLNISEDLLDGGSNIEILFRHVSQVLVAEEPSHKVRMKLLQGSTRAGQILDIDFPAKLQKAALITKLQHSDVAIIEKDVKWMDKAFARHEKDVEQCETPSKNTVFDDPTENPVPVRKPTPTPRRKISDFLQDANGEVGDETFSEEKRGSKRSSRWTDGNAESRYTSEDKKNRPDIDADAGVEIPVRTFKNIHNLPERETRSSTRRAPTNNDPFDDEYSGKEAAYLKNDTGRDKWKKPLIYPRNGKKKAEVNLDDRERLRPDEFLNDNLIAFYMRFIQDHLERTNKKAAERIYFFNSYFFATLTKTARGERGVNYSGVEKWTRAVDLFSYDYVVVPINENAHWYVAIICNLPSLALGSADSAEPVQTPTNSKESPKPQIEVDEIRETPQPQQASNSESGVTSDESSKPASEKGSKESETRKSFSHLSLGNKPEDQQSVCDSWPELDDTPTAPIVNFSKLSPQKHTNGQTRTSKSETKSDKKTRKGPRLSPSQTSIITFDSLGIGRSSTVRMLKDYICCEATAKRGVEIDMKMIKGMCARQIPLQPNFSDCGLYLLAYLEKFVQSPDGFISKTLRRDMDPDSDFPPLGSGLLRRRLRDFLDELYDEQRQANKHKTEPAQVMADRQPISFLLGPPLPARDKTADKEEIPESQPQQQSKTPNESEHPKDSTAVEIRHQQTRRIEDQESEDSSLDQMQMVPLTRPSPKSATASKISRSLKERSARSSPAREDPVIQVPDSQEEHQVPGTPPPKEMDRVRRSPRGPPPKG